MRFRLAHYDIREELGHGGMGVVYRARDTRLGRQLAIKVLPSLLRSDPERRGRFLREARAAAALNHPNIATVYEVGEAVLEPVVEEDDDDQATEIHRTTCLYIAMEYVAGQDLHELLGGEPLPVPRCLDFAIQVADALDTAHREGIIHRDLKPRNIRLTPEGRIKILDFGLAKVLQEDARMSSMLGGLGGDTPGTATPGDVRTVEGMIVGTVPYMAPEQVEGRDVDARSDLFAFGIVLYQMLAGQVPFPGPGLVQYVRALGAGPPGPPSAQNADVPVELDRVTLRLLARESGERYPSAGAVLADLRSLAGSEVGASRVPASIDPPFPRSGVPRQGPVRGKVAISALAVVAVLLGWGISSLRREDARPEQRELGIRPFTSSQEGSSSTWCIAAETEIRRAFLDQSEGISIVREGDEPDRRDLVIGGDCQELEGTQRLYVLIERGRSGEVFWDELIEPRGGITSDAAKEVAFLLRRSFSVLELYEKNLGLGPDTAFDAARSYLLGIRDLERALEPSEFPAIVRHFEQALLKAGDHAEAHARISETIWWAWRGLGPRDRDRFRQEVAAAIALAPTAFETLLAQSRLYELDGDLAGATRTVRKAAELDPSSARASHQLGWRLRRAGLHDEARDAFLLATRLRSGFWRYWNDLGSLFKDVFFEPEAARSAYERAVSLSPVEAIWPVENLSTAALDLADLDRAGELLDAVPENLHTGSFANALGRFHYYRRDWAASSRSFRKAVRMEPSNPIFLMNLGDALRMDGDVDAAFEAYSSAIAGLDQALGDFDRESREPLAREGEWLAARAFAQACSGNCIAAFRDADAAIKPLQGRPGHALALFYLASAFEICSRTDRARDVLQAAVGSGVNRLDVATSVAFGGQLSSAEIELLFDQR